MTMYAASAIAEAGDVEEALTRVLGDTAALWERHDIDLALVFVSPHFAPHYADVVQKVRQITGARLLLGCSGQGVIARTREAEDTPALALLIVAAPGADLRPVRFTQAQLARLDSPEAWREHTGVALGETNAWLLLADPFRMDCDALVEGLSAAYPGLPVMGGLASGDPRVQRSHVFLNDQVFSEGGVALAVGGALTVETVVAQGATPIGEAWTVTAAEANVIGAIGRRPAYELLMETLMALPEALRRRAQQNLLVGLAINEYRDSFGRGDFLIRNLLGADRQSGALAIGALPRVGQTMQFQIRDAESADQDLRELLAAAKRQLGERQPLAALLCACNGRGRGLFGAPDHDARAVAELLGPLPLAGFFCNGEIGPVGGANHLHGYTASLALLAPVDV